MAFSPDGGLALSGSFDKTLKLWDVTSGRELKSFAGHEGPVTTVAFSPDGKLALSGGGDRNVIFWDLASGRELNITSGHWESVTSVAFSPDGKLALSGSLDRTLTLWDVASGRELKSFTGHAAAVQSVAFSPDGRLALSGSDDQTLKLWDAGSGRELRSFTGHAGAIYSVAFSPDGKLALSGSLDRTLKLWNVASGRELRTFAGHEGRVASVAFSPSGKVVLSGSGDGTVRLWDAELRDEKEPLLATMLGARTGDWLTITPAGFYVASGEGAGKLLHVVRGFESYSILQFYEQLHRPDLVEAWLNGDAASAYRHAALDLNLDIILQSGKVPKLERLNNRASIGGKPRLAVRLVDQGGGIGEKVIWRVNGTEQGETTAPGLGGPVRPGHEVIVEQALRAGLAAQDEIEVVAHNGKGLLATEPLRFRFDPVHGAVR